MFPLTCPACPITVKKSAEKVPAFQSGSAVRKEASSGDLRRFKNQRIGLVKHDECGYPSQPEKAAK